MSEIFIITEGQKLVSLSHQPYESEDLLQSLLANYPSLLAGDQMRPDAPRRWALVKREAEIPGEENGAGRWSLDHLFLDQEGVPTLVEVKRSSDTRIRREVVGQMLDYAANGVKYWPLEALRASFELTCRDSGVDPEEKISELIGEEGKAEQFWIAVKTNLQAGRIRMLFVADEIPDELRRVVEFLNEQMDPAEVLAVEIKQFSGGALKTLVPRLIGQTIEAEDRKRVAASKTKRKWDEAMFFSALAERGAPSAIEPARKLLAWASSHASRVWWGEGQVNGSFIPVFERDIPKTLAFAVYTNNPGGKPYVQLYFQSLAKRAPFDSPEKRLELLQRLNSIPGVSIPAEMVDRWPSIPLAVLANEAALDRFLDTIEWLIGEVRSLAVETDGAETRP